MQDAGTQPASNGATTWSSSLESAPVTPRPPHLEAEVAHRKQERARPSGHMHWHVPCQRSQEEAPEDGLPCTRETVG